MDDKFENTKSLSKLLIYSSENDSLTSLVECFLSYNKYDITLYHSSKNFRKSENVPYFFSEMSYQTTEERK